MKKHTLLTLLREVKNLIVKFFKPYGLQDEMTSIPKNVMRIGLKTKSLQFFSTAISLAFAFMLKLTNIMFEHKLIMIGIAIFMLYRGQHVVNEALRVIQSSERKKFDLIFNDEIVLRGSQIIGTVTDKVLKFDTSYNLYRVMNNEAVLNSVKNYLKSLWQQKIQHIFDLLEIISTIAMLVVAILTNTAIPQVVFIPMIITFVIFSFLSSAYISLNRDEYYQKNKSCNDEQSLIVNDLLRVPAIVKGDLSMRINRFQKSVVESNENVTKFHKKLNMSFLVTTILETLSHYVIIVLYLLNVEWSSISLATITEITATLLIVETAMNYIGSIAEVLNSSNERITVIEKEEPNMSLILEVYHNEVTKVSIPKIIEEIHINPFSIKYPEESDNDKPFTLTSKDSIHIGKGEIVILSGVSGSGKSTFMKMLTERIKLEKSTDVPTTSRFLFYDEKLKFGSLSIFEELFCCSENPDLEKMQEILKNLHLWPEIKANCLDVWQWMKEKQFGQTLSNGQRQRLIIAKMLYWLDSEIDVVVLDEATSGLDAKSEADSADAERILEYIVRYCNKDKKRITIISTHQDIDGFKESLAGEFMFQNLHFAKDCDCNLVKKI